MQTIAMDVEQFIESVRKRPALWDTHSEEYKDRGLRKDGWLEVCRIMCPDITDKSEKERVQIGREVQLKWKNLRDAYVRHIRMKLDRSKQSKPIRSYIYYKQMSFLNGVIQPRTRSRGPSFHSTTQFKVKLEQDEDEEEELTQEDLMELQHDVSSSMTTPDQDVADEEKLATSVDPFSEVIENDSHNNDDLNFFKSLLPTLQTLRTDQKLKFRIDVMELLMTYHQAATDRQ